MSGLGDGPGWLEEFRQHFVHTRPAHGNQAPEEPDLLPPSDDEEEEEEEQQLPDEHHVHWAQDNDEAEERDRRLEAQLRRNDRARLPGDFGVFEEDDEAEEALEPIEHEGERAAAAPRPPTWAQVAAEEAREKLGSLPSTIRAAWKNASLFQSDADGDAITESSSSSIGQRLKPSPYSSSYVPEGSSTDKDAISMLGKRSLDAMEQIYETGDYCFLCWWGDNGEDAVRADVWNKMVSLWMENIHWMGEEEAACTVSEYQYEHIVAPMRADGKRVGDFPPAMVLEHFTMHVLDPRLEAAAALRDLKLLRREILKSIRKTNAVTGDTCIDKDQISNLKNTMAMMRDIYAWPVKKMQFYVPEYRIDSKETKSLFSLHRNFEYAPKDTSKRRKRAVRPPR